MRGPVDDDARFNRILHECREMEYAEWVNMDKTLWIMFIYSFIFIMGLFMCMHGDDGLLYGFMTWVSMAGLPIAILGSIAPRFYVT
jgi:hypothetical protein